ncbi:MAG TPA: WecB/TagA/CpsF family glycosyltransferase [Ktedonobacterales bacterium]
MDEVANPPTGDQPAPPRSTTVLGVRVDLVAPPEALARIAAWLGAPADPTGRPARQVVTLNPEMVMAARADPAFRAVIAAADLVLPDGVGVVWAARRRGAGITRRVTGIDTLLALAGLAAERGWRVFLLGAAPGVAAAAAGALRRRWPALAIAGAHAGGAGPAEDAATCALVRASGADLLFVAYGAPAQELWLARNRAALGVAVGMGVGGAPDVLAGRVPRAPAWLRRLGLEWAWRLAREPWRWRRMLALPRFAALVLAAGRRPEGTSPPDSLSPRGEEE